MRQKIHTQSTDQPNTSHIHSKTKALLFAGVLLTSLNVGLLNESTKASADNTTPDVSLTSNFSTSESPTQPLSQSPRSANGDSSTSKDATSTDVTPEESVDDNTTPDDSTTDDNRNDLTPPNTAEINTGANDDAKAKQKNTSTPRAAAPEPLASTNTTTGIADNDHATSPENANTVRAAVPVGDMVQGTTPDQSVNATASQAITAQKGTVYVYYKMDTGGELLKKVLTGNVGDRFTVNALNFNDGDAKDFMLKGASQINGTYTSTKQTVTFIYQVPRIRTSSQAGMDIFTVTYADGSLKYIEIFDDDFDITLSKNSKGQSSVAIYAISPASRNKTLSLANNDVATFGHRFGYFSTSTNSFIFEKSTNSRLVKVMKVNNQSEKLTVRTLNLDSPNGHLRAISKTLEINNATLFNHFWAKYVDGDIQSAFSIQERTGNSPQLSAKAAVSEVNPQGRARLPQTSEDKTSFSFYGYLLLFLLSTVRLFGKVRKVHESKA
ncbi:MULTISPECIES: MucBP domain-containing protein [Lactobacillaceae]|uniref:MucBP domain-containing protein n=1 Tax=Lactobacillaceae TaxID=33958 RepID=UPI0014563472|nr:MucBP domain-containing protein [Lactobacillus sp. HBUAS51381]NLR09818.1 MucBP domain-containing protein [Lactobacillus sp. HBUAS51381]